MKKTRTIYLSNIYNQIHAYGKLWTQNGFFLVGRHAETKVNLFKYSIFTRSMI